MVEPSSSVIEVDRDYRDCYPRHDVPAGTYLPGLVLQWCEFAMIDLHVHTNISDGTLSPEEVVRLAAAKGIRAIAVTDHDTVSGIARAQAEGLSAGVEIVPGLEVSTQWEHGILHVLGYFMDPHDTYLIRTLDYLRQGRQERIPKIIEKLRQCSVEISEGEVYEESVGGVPGRPHVANVLVQKNYAKTLQDAFDRYLKRGAPAYVEKTKLPMYEAMRVISASGGLPVLAHPHSLNENDANRLETFVRDLQNHGLKGIEVYYSAHSAEQTELYLNLATRLSLAVTGGTDFHGSNRPGIELGRLPCGKLLPYSLLENLKNRL